MGYNPKDNDVKVSKDLSEWEEYTELALQLKAAKALVVVKDRQWLVLNDENEELGRKLKFQRDWDKVHEETIDLQVKLNNSLERQRIDLEDKVERLELLNRRTEGQLGQFKVMYRDESEENITLCADLKAMTGRFEDVARAHGKLMDERDMLKATVIDQAMKIAGMKL